MNSWLSAALTFFKDPLMILVVLFFFIRSLDLSSDVAWRFSMVY